MGSKIQEICPLVSIIGDIRDAGMVEAGCYHKKSAVPIEHHGVGNPDLRAFCGNLVMTFVEIVERCPVQRQEPIYCLLNVDKTDVPRGLWDEEQRFLGEDERAGRDAFASEEADAFAWRCLEENVLVDVGGNDIYNRSAQQGSRNEETHDLLKLAGYEAWRVHHLERL